MHSPEPWRKVPENELGYCAAGPGIEDAQQNAVVNTVCGECLGSDERLSEANADRIVACVNALKGIPTEWLENQNHAAAVQGMFRTLHWDYPRTPNENPHNVNA